MRKALDPLCVDLQIARRAEAQQHRRRSGTCTPRSPDACVNHPPPHWISRSHCIRRRRSAAYPRTPPSDADHRTGGRPRLLRGRGGLVRQRGRRPLGGVDPLRAAVRRPAHRRTPTSGGGIVAESDPDDEVAETTTKFRTILSALGVEPVTRASSACPTGRRGRVDRDGARTRRVRARRRRVHASPRSSCTTALFGGLPTVVRPRRRGGRRAPPRCALWFRNFSTWDGVAGIYLEDLFVRPQFRRHGLARRCWRRSPASASTTATRGWSGRCWTGTSTRSRCTTPSAVDRRASGSPIGCRARSCRRSPTPSRRDVAARPLQRRRAEQQRQHGHRDQRDGHTVEPTAASRRPCTRPPAAAAAGRTPRRPGPIADRSTAPIRPPARPLPMIANQTRRAVSAQPGGRRSPPRWRTTSDRRHDHEHGPLQRHHDSPPDARSPARERSRRRA